MFISLLLFIYQIIFFIIFLERERTSSCLLLIYCLFLPPINSVTYKVTGEQKKKKNDAFEIYLKKHNIDLTSKKFNL